MTIDRLVQTLLESGAHRATYYKGEKEIVRVTRMIETWKGKKRFNQKDHTITLTMGKPNVREQEFIKVCKKAGEPFPVKQPQLQFLRA